MDVRRDGESIVQFEAGGRQGGRAGGDAEALPAPHLSGDARAERQTRARAARGDASAWRELVAAHLAEVWALAVRLTRDQDQAALVCETVWLRLAQDLPVATTEPLSGWLGRAVREEARRVDRSPLVIRLPRDADDGVRGRVVSLPRPRDRML